METKGSLHTHSSTEVSGIVLVKEWMDRHWQASCRSKYLLFDFQISVISTDGLMTDVKLDQSVFPTIGLSRIER